MGRVSGVVVAALVMTLSVPASTQWAVAAPPTTPPATPTQGDVNSPPTTRPDQRPRRTTTTTGTPPASGNLAGDDDDGSWSVQRIAVTGGIAIAGLSLLGWAVARIRNALARPSIK